MQNIKTYINNSRVHFTSSLVRAGFLTALLVFFAALNLWTQNQPAATGGSVFDYPLSASALPSYNAICGQLAGRPYTKGSYEETRTQIKPKRSITARGDFIIAADMGMVWITKYPAPSVTTMGKDFLVRTVPGKKSTRIEAKGNETYISMADTISSVFTGNSGKLNEMFTVYFREIQSQNGTKWTLGLMPKDKVFAEIAERIILEGTSGAMGAVITSVVFREKNGNSVTYAFSEHSFPKELNAQETAYFSVK